MFKKTLATALVFAGGAAAGIAFVVSCGDSGSSGSSFGLPAAVAALNCSQYQVMPVDIEYADGVVSTVPEGWVPFGIEADYNYVIVTQCAP